jgi:hypothetical protein
MRGGRQVRENDRLYILNPTGSGDRYAERGRKVEGGECLNEYIYL